MNRSQHRKPLAARPEWHRRTARAKRSVDDPEALREQAAGARMLDAQGAEGRFVFDAVPLTERQ